MLFHSALSKFRKSSNPTSFSSLESLRFFSSLRKRPPLRSSKPQKKEKGIPSSSAEAGVIENWSAGGGSVGGNQDVWRKFPASVGEDYLRLGLDLSKVSIQKQILDTLYRGDRSKASSLLLDLGNGDHSLAATDFVDILRYCARSPDPLFAMETWKIMGEKGISADNLSYLLSMQALCKGGYLEEAFNLLKFTREGQVFCSSLPVYNTFLGAGIKMKSVGYISQCLDLMEQRMVGKDEVTFMELLKIAVWQENLSAVQQIWEDYIKLYSPSLMSLRKFIFALAKLGDLESACQRLEQMLGLTSQGNIHLKNTSKRMRSSRLDIPIPLSSPSDSCNFPSRESEKDAPLEVNAHTLNAKANTRVHLKFQRLFNTQVELAKDDKAPAINLLRWSFGDIIHASVRVRSFRLAYRLIVQMQNLGLQPSSYIFDGYIKAVLRTKGIDEAMEVLEVMRQRNLKPMDSTLATLSSGCSKVLELDSAEGLLDRVSNYKYPHPYNLFLKACDLMDQPERAIRMFAKMRQLNILPDISTFETLFSLFGNVNAPYEEGSRSSQVDSSKRIKVIEMEMAKVGVQHSHSSLMNLLKALGAEGMIRELIQYLRWAEDSFSRRNLSLGTLVYNVVLHSLVLAKETDLAIEMFKNMRANGVMPDLATYTIMIVCSTVIRCYKSASALISMMLRDGFCPRKVTYTAFLKILIKTENVEAAFSLVDLLISEKIPPDRLFYNTILKRASFEGRLDVVELIVERMRRENIQPDPSTCCYVFHAYDKQKHHDTALEALQVLSLRMMCQEDKGLLEREERFNDLILSDDSDAEMRIILELFSSEENVAFALLNLRWCCILGLPTTWFPNETTWAKRTSSTYDDVFYDTGLKQIE